MPLPCPPSSGPGKLHSDCKTHPHFPPKFGEGSASYSLKNTAINTHSCFNMLIV